MTLRPEVDLWGEPIEQKSRGRVSDTFLIPPFSDMNARGGWWQTRKREWLSLGIRSEVGRDAELNMGRNANAENGWALADDAGSGVSVFDPVLCELAYRWFCPPGGTVVDPFAGGSVRGVVAGYLGRRYWGCDLRAEQVAANETQADDIAHADGCRPEWHVGDAVDALSNAPAADMVFSCPPYGDLERYSDDARDLSAMDYHAFVAAYRFIVWRAVQRMRPDSFAAFVVGNYRDEKSGTLRDLVSTTVNAFVEAGCDYYNEAVLITAVGTAAMRVSKQFNVSRKFCRTHQTVLVFVKGCPRRAAARCGSVDVSTMEEGNE